MAQGAPTPTLNDTAPPVNLLGQWFPSAPKNAGPIQTTHAVTAHAAPISIDFSGVIPVVFSVVFLIWVIYTLVIIYHWFRYRHQSLLAVPAIAIHLFVSGSLMVFMISGLR